MSNISLKFKIFLLCVTLYAVSLVATSFIITESNYQNMLNGELQRFLIEEQSMSKSISFYITAYQKYYGTLFLERLVDNIMQEFSQEDTVLQVYDDKKTLLASNKADLWKKYSLENIDTALDGSRNYIFRIKDDKHFLTISAPVYFQSSTIILNISKDITYIDDFRKNQYAYFVKAGFGVFFIACFIGYFLISMTMLPIKRLSETTELIASGKFSERVMVKQKDEVGKLASQFNKMAEEIEINFNKLKEENGRKQRFIDSLTHELRTPLTSIIGYSDFLLNSNNIDSSYQIKSLNYIKSEGKRMLNMIENLMELILLRKNAVETEEVELQQLFDEVKDVLDLKAQRQGVKLIIQGEKVIVNVDKDMFKQLLINLVDNAIKASSGGSEVIIRSESNKEKLTIFVEDSGKGIDSKEVDKILEPFYTVDKSRSRKEGGVGLGLAICSEILKAHNANLQIKSEIGKGTTVEIYL